MSQPCFWILFLWLCSQWTGWLCSGLSCGFPKDSLAVCPMSRERLPHCLQIPVWATKFISLSLEMLELFNTPLFTKAHEGAVSSNRKSISIRSPVPELVVPHTGTVTMCAFSIQGWDPSRVDFMYSSSGPVHIPLPFPPSLPLFVPWWEWNPQSYTCWTNALPLSHSPRP